METDPYTLQQSKLTCNKIILGSFPTWSLTTADPGKDETEEMKLIERRKNGDLPFYYGSSKNVFWKWYSAFFDNSVQPTDLLAIKHSLNSHNVGVTNIILRAVRKGKSSFDYDLSQREYNHSFFEYPFEREKLKLLCTSKAVLNEMLLSNSFKKVHPRIEIHQEASSVLNETLFQNIDIEPSQVNQPLCCSLAVNNGGIIECIAIPSPGSPFRGLQYFGKKDKIQSKYFLRQYLQNAFSWFKD